MKDIIDLTEFGDLAVTLPLVAVVFAWMLWNGLRNAALWWAVVVAFCGGCIGLLKIFFYACPPVRELASPSGHASLSTVVYGGIAVLVAAPLRGWQRLVIALAAGSFILGIAVSRVVLHAHTLIETTVGLAVGLLALAFFAWRYLPRAAVAPVWPLTVAAALLAVGMHGEQLRAEVIIRELSRLLYSRVLACG